MTAIVTSTSSAIYSFSAATEFSADVKTTNLSGTQTRVVAQIQASGTGLDLSSLLLNGQTASVSGIADSRMVTSFAGPTLQSDYMAIWDFAASPLDEYSLAFNSLGPHMSLEAVRIDAFASDTAFVTPASVTAVPEPASIGSVLALTCGGGIRWLRRRKSSAKAKRS
ncbi:PEP-CTERM sorting domain-containing protein [Crateriforma conspicua]|nr:PEP-CTERM sorting domain-containing protein [Crateriforma conspicua]